MPHRKSAVTHIRADKRKQERNSRRKSSLRTMLRKTEEAIVAGDAQLAQEFYPQAAGHLDRAAQKGIIKKGAADRKKSRLARKINQMAAA